MPEFADWVRSMVRVDGKLVGTITPAGDKQFRATTTGGRNLGYFRSEGAAERVLRTYAGKVASNHKRRNA
jgi:hypothetical protein